jgi:hypothetical protein
MSDLAANSFSAFPPSDSRPSLTAPGAPTFKLYSPLAVGVATFIGSVLAGSWLLALNYRRLGKPREAIVTILLGLATLFGMLVIGSAVSTDLSLGVSIGITLAMGKLTRSFQGQQLDAHAAAGGKLASVWNALGLSLISVVLIMGGCFAYGFATTPTLGTKLAAGSKDAVFYSGTATEADAQALADALKKDGVFRDLGSQAVLAKGTDGTILSFFVRDGAWDQADSVKSFESIARDVAPAIGGLPIKFRLLSTKRVIEKEMILNP